MKNETITYHYREGKSWCSQCGEELLPGENSEYCSLCVSATEHAADNPAWLEVQGDG